MASRDGKVAGFLGRAFGKRLVAELTPFVSHLAASGLSPTSVRRHIHSLWLLGGKIVRDASLYDEQSRPVAELLDEAIGPDDGPLVSDLSESEQRSFDATSRKLYRFRQGTAFHAPSA